jgi:hypothetical protein
MKKNNVLFLVIMLIGSFMLFGCNEPVEVPGGLPTLEQAVKYSNDKINETVSGLTKKQLHALWGKPTTTTVTKLDVWIVNQETGDQVVVQYERQNGKLIAVMAMTGKTESTQSFKYTLRGEGYGGGKFVITINGDGTFSYTEGDSSNYVGTGTWTTNDDGLLCLKEKADMSGFERTNYFTSFSNLLIWVAENSDNFKYVQLSGGNIFARDE